MALAQKRFFRNAIFSLLTLLSLALINPLQARATQTQADTTVSTGDVEFTDIPSTADKVAEKKATDSVATVKKDSATAIKPAVQANAAESTPTSLWQLFIIGFVGGFAAFLLPCVYPMLPLTVSFFTKKGGTRAKAIWQSCLYGLSIIFIYVVFGLLITIIFGPAALNGLATNGIFNFAFFLMLITFGASFLGAFEITLPSSFANKLDENSDKGGVAGIFFMAATLVVVSFSCTGPAIGGVLANAFIKGERLAPAILMFGFSLAIALPFTLFAMFPSALKSLPKSGGWLNSVKVVLGFIEIAFALKFLSNVDLAYHWNLIDREVVLSLWIAIGVLASLYLLGKIKFSHDSDVQHLTVTRTFIAMGVIAFTLYMVPGLWGAPLKSVSALLPPLSTQDFDLSSGASASNTKAASASIGINVKEKKYEQLFKRLPKVKGLDEWYDFDQAVEVSKQVNKPILLDFTGWNCVNCREMEQDIMPLPNVFKRLSSEFVMVQMVIDDKTELPQNEQYTSTVTGKNISTIGGKNLDFEIKNYNSNAQPFYVIVDQTGKALVKPMGATKNPAEFVKYLDSGIAAFKASK